MYVICAMAAANVIAATAYTHTNVGREVSSTQRSKWGDDTINACMNAYAYMYMCQCKHCGVFDIEGDGGQAESREHLAHTHICDFDISRVHRTANTHTHTARINIYHYHWCPHRPPR